MRSSLLLLVAFAAVPLVAQAPKIHLIHLDPQPSISGGCPAHVHFTGRIETTGPMQVDYQWLRSDGSHTEHALVFRRAQSIPVATNWTLGGRYSGTMQLVILAPQHMQTAKASFSVNCP